MTELYDWDAPEKPHPFYASAANSHPEDSGLRSHPFWHICRKCVSPLKAILWLGAVNIFWEVVTMVPVHRLFEHLGWI